MKQLTKLAACILLIFICIFKATTASLEGREILPIVYIVLGIFLSLYTAKVLINIVDRNDDI